MAVVVLLQWLVSTQPLLVQKGEDWIVRHGEALPLFDGHGMALVLGWLWPGCLMKKKSPLLLVTMMSGQQEQKQHHVDHVQYRYVA